MHFRMSAETLGEFVRIRQMLSAQLDVRLDLESDEFMTELFHSCGHSSNEPLRHAADKLWANLSKDNPEMDKRKELNHLHKELQRAAS
jgi:hypothetical protein